MTDKRIITCAVTGSSLAPSMSAALPVTPAQIIEQSLDAVTAGAAILHLHARDPETGRPTNDTAVWAEFITELQLRSDAIINMSASLGSSAEDRLSAVLALKPDIATVIVGSMNYGLFNEVRDQGVTDFAHPWEQKMYGPSSDEIVTNNSFAKIGRMIELLQDHGIGMEFEIYDVGHLYILAEHLSRRPVSGPLIVQFLTGILGGIPSGPEHLLHLRHSAERLFGKDLVLFTHGTGRNNMRTATAGVLMGTHLRVGQEDTLFDLSRRPYESNAEQVDRIRQVIETLEYDVASPAEARAMLDLPRRA